MRGPGGPRGKSAGGKVWGISPPPMQELWRHGAMHGFAYCDKDLQHLRANHQECLSA